MRYGNPSTPSVIGRLQDAGCERHRVLPALPAVFRADHRHRQRPGVPGADAAEAGSRRSARCRPTTTIRSTSRRWRGRSRRPTPGSPRRPGRAGDELPRHAGALPRARAIPTTASARRRRGSCASGSGSGRDEVVVSFQSRFGPEEWLKPYTVEEVARLAAGRQAAHRDHGAGVLGGLRRDARGGPARRSARASSAAGGEAFTYIPCLNADAGARRHDGGDPRARARRLDLTPVRPLSAAPWAMRSRRARPEAGRRDAARSAARDRRCRRRGSRTSPFGQDLDELALHRDAARHLDCLIHRAHPPCRAFVAWPGYRPES